MRFVQEEIYLRFRLLMEVEWSRLQTEANCADMFMQPVLLEKLRWSVDFSWLAGSVMIKFVGQGMRQIVVKVEIVGS
uniref:Uncharacterized protein n=1 Tax=Picea sitchensis TaxID=3332 RepID=D5AA84_PICSI|nr:unknown [Picea sitchensis]